MNDSDSTIGMEELTASIRKLIEPGKRDVTSVRKDHYTSVAEQLASIQAAHFAAVERQLVPDENDAASGQHHAFAQQIASIQDAHFAALERQLVLDEDDAPAREDHLTSAGNALKNVRTEVSSHENTASTRIAYFFARKHQMPVTKDAASIQEDHYASIEKHLLETVSDQDSDDLLVASSPSGALSLRLASCSAVLQPETGGQAPLVEDDADEAVTEGNECIICLTRARTHACVPCGHKCCCGECAQQLGKECPMCRCDLQLIMRVYE